MNDRRGQRWLPAFALQAWRDVPPGMIESTLGLLLRALIQAVVFIVVARLLGPADYGQFVSLVCVGLLAVPAVTLGLELDIMRGVASGRITPGNALVAGLRRTCGVSLPLVPLLAGLCVLVLPAATSWSIALPVLAADILCGAWLELAWRLFQSVEKMRHVALLRVAPAGARLLALVPLGCGWLTISLQTWALLYAGAVALAALLALRVARATFGEGTVAAACSSISRDGLAFTLQALAERAAADLDKILLANLTGPAVAGLYGAASRLVELCGTPAGALVLGANARMFRAGTVGPARLRAECGALLRVLGALGLVTSLAVLLCAPLVPVLLGERYAESVAMARAMALFPLLLSLRFALGLALSAAGGQTRRTFVQLGAAMGSLLGALWAIPVWGWQGMLATTLLVEMLATAMLALSLRGALVRASVSRGQ